jgi:hypothetical protein
MLPSYSDKLPYCIGRQQASQIFDTIDEMAKHDKKKKSEENS